MVISILSFHCSGAAIYQKLGQQYASPFIGHLFRNDDDFVKFCLHLEHYINIEPKIITKSKYPRYTGVSNKKYVITLHDDIEIHWIHDYHAQNVISKFQQRKQRLYKSDGSLDKNNIIIIFSETNLHKNKKNPEKFKDFITKFSKIRFRKVFFSSKEIHIEGIDTSFVKVVPKWKDKKFWEKCGEDFHCRNGTCPGCGRTSYGNYGGEAEQYIKSFVEQ